MTDEPLLRGEGLKKHYSVTKGILLARTVGYVKAVDGVSFVLDAGRTVGLFGESGCGKTTTSKLILDLEARTGRQVLLDGEPINGIEGGALRRT